MDTMTITLIITILAIIFFITNIIPIGATAIFVPLALYFTGIITEAEALKGWSDTNTIMFLFMLIIGDSLQTTGVAKRLSLKISTYIKTELQVLVAFGVLAVCMSTFLSNIGTLVVLAPIIMGICRENQYNPARVMMPIAFCTTLGGMNSLAGATPPVIVQGALLEIGDSFGFFEYAIIGLPLCILGLLYLSTVGIRLFPEGAREINDELTHISKTDENMESNRNQLISIQVFVLVVVLMVGTSFFNIPLWASAMAGVLILLCTKVLTLKQAFNAVDWPTIILMAGMGALATAMDASGLAQKVADICVSLLGGNPSEHMYVLVVFICACIITQIVTNTTAAALFAPIVVTIAKTAGMDPKLGLMTLAVAAATAFMTPMGTSPNMVIMSYADYKFTDFLKLGTPLTLIVAVTTVILLPIVY